MKKSQLITFDMNDLRDALKFYLKEEKGYGDINPDGFRVTVNENSPNEADWVVDVEIFNPFEHKEKV